MPALTAISVRAYSKMTRGWRDKAGGLMAMTGIRVRGWMATMRFTLCLLLTIFVGLSGALCAADQTELQRRLFERYDRQDVVCIVPGVVVGLDISAGLQPDFGVEYTHFSETLAIPEEYRLQKQLDERSFVESDVQAAWLDRLAPGERLNVSDFYASRDGLVFYLISPSTTRFGPSVGLGYKKSFGVKFTFEFSPEVMESGDYEAVVREVNKYFLPVSEYREALQAAEEQRKAPRRIEIRPGISEQEIINALGVPEQTIVFGNKTILNYPGISVELQDERATDVKAR
jgi:hypothetical protein